MTTPNDPNEFFGAMPQRPDHPDFWKLSNVLMRLDRALDPSNPDQEALERAYEERLAEIGVDQKSVAYMATQRAFRALGIESRAELLFDPQKAHLAIMLSSIWLDAFAAGVFFERGDS